MATYEAILRDGEFKLLEPVDLPKEARVIITLLDTPLQYQPVDDDELLNVSSFYCLA